MLEIVETRVNLVFPVGQHRHCLLAQIPAHLGRSEVGYVVADPERQWRLVESVFDAVERDPVLRKLHFLLFPEGCLPLSHLDRMLETIDRMRPNAVTMIGLEHIPLHGYRELLERHREDNAAALALVEQDAGSGIADAGAH